MMWNGPAPAPIANLPLAAWLWLWICSSVEFEQAEMREGREYFFAKLGRGCKKGGPPMSAMLSFPLRPGAARLKGGFERLGQGTMVTEEDL